MSVLRLKTAGLLLQLQAQTLVTQDEIFTICSVPLKEATNAAARAPDM